jgi:hypothetical protein
MPIAPFLALNSRSGTPQLKRYINATPAFVGVTFGTGDTDTAASLDTERGYVPGVKFGGSQTFLATVGNEVYRSTDGAATWTLVKTFTTGTHINTNVTVAKSGLFVLHVAGVATAVVITHNHGTANYYAHTSTNGTSWTTLGAFAAGGTSFFSPQDSVVMNGKLLTLWESPLATSFILSTFDPATGTMTFATLSVGGASYHGALAVFNNRLFALTMDNASSGRWLLHELIAGVWTLVETLSVGFSSTTAKGCLFVDGSNMVGMVPPTPTTTGWKCYSWDSVLVRTTRTSTAIPTALASGLADTQRMSMIVDNRTTPGSVPTFWIYQSVSGAAASALNQWQWNGVSSFIGTLPGSAASAPNDSGGSARDNLPWVQHAQGATFWTSGEAYLEQQGTSAAVGGITTTFKLYSDAGTGTASVRAWRGVADDEYPLSAATLTGTLTGLAKDNTTVHSIVWQAVTDGFAAGQRAKFVLEQY